MAKNTFFNSFENAKNANFDRLTWTTICDVIIEYIRNMIASSDSSLNSVSDRVLEHVPKFKTDQNMLILSLTKNRQTDRYCYYFVDKEHSGGSMLPWHLRYFVLYSFLRRLCRKRRKRCRKIHIYILFNVLSINKWSNLIGRCILGITRFYVFLFAANNYTGCSTYNPLKTIRF